MIALIVIAIRYACFYRDNDTINYYLYLKLA